MSFVKLPRYILNQIFLPLNRRDLAKILLSCKMLYNNQDDLLEHVARNNIDLIIERALQLAFRLTGDVFANVDHSEKWCGLITIEGTKHYISTDMESTWNVMIRPHFIDVVSADRFLMIDLKKEEVVKLRKGKTFIAFKKNEDGTYPLDLVNEFKKKVISYSDLKFMPEKRLKREHLCPSAISILERLRRFLIPRHKSCQPESIEMAKETIFWLSRIEKIGDQKLLDKIRDEI